MEKMRALGKPSLGMSYRAGGREFNVNELTNYIKYGIFKQKHTESKVMYWWVGENVVTRGSQEPDPVSHLEQWFRIRCLNVPSDFIEHTPKARIDYIKVCK